MHMKNVYRNAGRTKSSRFLTQLNSHVITMQSVTVRFIVNGRPLGPAPAASKYFSRNAPRDQDRLSREQFGTYVYIYTIRPRRRLHSDASVPRSRAVACHLLPPLSVVARVISTRIALSPACSSRLSARARAVMLRLQYPRFDSLKDRPVLLPSLTLSHSI